jgi:hypothetical protein
MFFLFSEKVWNCSRKLYEDAQVSSPFAQRDAPFGVAAAHHMRVAIVSDIHGNRRAALSVSTAAIGHSNCR